MSTARIVAPLAAAGGHNEIAGAIYYAFSGLCHQRPDRSFFIDGHKFGVCSRCTGIYFGFAFTLLVYPLLMLRRNQGKTYETRADTPFCRICIRPRWLHHKPGPRPAGHGIGLHFRRKRGRIGQ